MEKIGLIAGKGVLPVEFARSAGKQGCKVIVFAIRDMASPELEREAEKLYWMNVGEYTKFAFLLIKEHIRHIALVGKVDKEAMYKSAGSQDKIFKEALKGLRDRKDYSILEEITKHFSRFGVEVIDTTKYLAHLLPEKGILSRKTPDDKMAKDIDCGYSAAKKIAEMDIGQTVIVKDGNIVAVEAMEGTDAAIRRAYQTAGEGCIMVKVSRPRQDMRWDVPTVGPDTIVLLAENKFICLAIESGRMFLIDKEKTAELADSAGMVIKIF